jgi:DNA-binding Xre family transcriptional regulator
MQNIDVEEKNMRKNKIDNLTTVLRLSEIMDMKEISNAQLAEMTGIDPSNMHKYVSGKVMPTVSTLRVIAMALNCNIEQLIKH